MSLKIDKAIGYLSSISVWSGWVDVHSETWEHLATLHYFLLINHTVCHWFVCQVFFQCLSWCPRACLRSFSCQIGSHIEVRWPTYSKPPPQNVWPKLLLSGSGSRGATSGAVGLLGYVSAGVSPPTVTRLTSAAAAPAGPTRRCTALQLHKLHKLHTALRLHVALQHAARQLHTSLHGYCTLFSTCHYIYKSAFQFCRMYDAGPICCAIFCNKIRLILRCPCNCKTVQCTC